jgi:hypothetical protein
VSGRGEIRAKAEAAYRGVQQSLLSHLDDGGRLVVVQAPPGSGKTYLLIEALVHSRKRDLRLAVATQTNAQADDICRRLALAHPSIKCVRFAAQSATPVSLGRSVVWETETKSLPTGPCVVVATTAKWGLVQVAAPFDLLFVEEAWQMSWDDLMLLSQVAARFVLIGDPGQAPPVVTIETARWETAPRAPHRPAPELILEEPSLLAFELSLPATRRLPFDTTEMIRPFYRFGFDSWAGPDERAVEVSGRSKGAVGAAVDLLATGSAAAITMPTPDGGPPLERDDELAAKAVEVVKQLLDRDAKVLMDGHRSGLLADKIGLCATHRVMVSAIELRLPKKLRGQVRVDTPERWQGLECDVMVMVHPLSGVSRPSAFDLETGRLCVMASRHKAGLVVVSRDHLRDTLDEYLPVADQAVGRPDVAGRGHAQNLAFWSVLEDRGRVAAER